MTLTDSRKAFKVTLEEIVVVGGSHGQSETDKIIMLSSIDELSREECRRDLADRLFDRMKKMAGKGGDLSVVFLEA